MFRGTFLHSLLIQYFQNHIFYSRYVNILENFQTLKTSNSKIKRDEKFNYAVLNLSVQALIENKIDMSATKKIYTEVNMYNINILLPDFLKV